MLYLVVGFLMVLGISAVAGTTRKAQLKRMARRFNLRYQTHVDSPLTPLSAKEMKLFGRGFHRFSQVLTWADPGAFIRACEDRVYASPFAKSPQTSYTLWTAELTRGTFTPFLLYPRTSSDTLAAHPALPSELAARYILVAPKEYQLPVSLMKLLSATRNCYVETTSYSLVYHEYKTIPVSQLQQTRSHVKTYIKELSQMSATIPPVAAGSTLAMAELQANTMLTLQQNSHSAQKSSNFMRILYILIGFSMLSGILIAARHFLTTLMH